MFLRVIEKKIDFYFCAINSFFKWKLACKDWFCAVFPAIDRLSGNFFVLMCKQALGNK